MTPKRQFLIFLTFVIGFVLLLMVIFGRGPGSKSGSTAKKTEVKKAFNLNDYSQRNSRVVAIVDGPITGEDTHRAMRFTVSRDSRLVEVIQGYQGKVIKTQSYPNNAQAYDDFIHALAKTGFGREKKTPLASEQGVCAAGRRYVFEVYDNEDRVSRTWTAGCVTGSALALPDSVVNLFVAQISDYTKFASGVWVTQ